MYALGVIETRLAEFLWENAPTKTAEVVAWAQEKLSWKRTTTYTVLKRFCERGLFCMEDGIVTVKLSREAYYAGMSGQFVEETFSGSLPAFLAAFSSQKRLTEAEIDELQKMIDAQRRENAK